MTKPIKPVSSPCIRHCCLNEQDVCMGCFRTLEEILAWHQSDDAQRITILTNAEKRARQKAQAGKLATIKANKHE